jgi:hypothetical protein
MNKKVSISLEEYEYLLGCKKRAESIRASQRKYDRSKKRKAQRENRREEIRKSIWS